MSKLLILLGSKEGPWCSLTRFTRPAVRVSGLEEDAKVLVELRSDMGFGVLAEINRNGEWPLNTHLPTEGYENSRFDWIRAACDQPKKETICTVIQAVRPEVRPWSPVAVVT